MRATSSGVRRSRHTCRLARLSRRRAAVLETPPPDIDQRIAPPPDPAEVAARMARSASGPKGRPRRPYSDRNAGTGSADRSSCRTTSTPGSSRR